MASVGARFIALPKGYGSPLPLIPIPSFIRTCFGACESELSYRRPRDQEATRSNLMVKPYWILRTGTLGSRQNTVHNMTGRRRW